MEADSGVCQRQNVMTENIRLYAAFIFGLLCVVTALACEFVAELLCRTGMFYTELGCWLQIRADKVLDYALKIWNLEY
jgi:hypothetical protein